MNEVPPQFVGKNFQPGQSGNPLGNALDRHSTKPLTKRLKEMLDQDIDYKALDNNKKKMKISDALLTALIAKALFKQDVQAAKLLYDRLEGSVTQFIEQDVTSGGKAITWGLNVSGKVPANVTIPLPLEIKEDNIDECPTQ